MGNMTNSRNLTSKLGWKNKEPKLKLIEMNNLVVKVPTQEKYDLLMQICQTGGWRWNNRVMDPIENNYWNNLKSQTCVTTSNGLLVASKYYWNKHNYGKISFNDFINIQGLSKLDLKEINNYFEENFSDRVSKGIKN